MTENLGQEPTNGGATSDAPPRTEIAVDIVSDVVCPWCIIGYKQLGAGLAQVGEDLLVRLQWHPFELNPDMPAAGQDLREHVAEKYGSTAEESRAARERLTALGDSLGFAFRYGEDARIYNTFQAHQLLHWAGLQGHQTALKMALFDSYFTRQENVSDPALLVEVAARAGLDGAEATRVLQDAPYAQAVRENENYFRQHGIQGVPTIFIDRRIGLTGAQGAETYARAARQALSERAA